MSLILDGSVGVSDIDGSAATPAIRGTDTNTGIFFPAADTIAFSEGGVEAARFDSSGRLLIGTTASASDNISGSGIQSSLQVKNNTAIRSTDGTATLFLTRAGTSVGTGTTVGRISFQQPISSDSLFSGPVANITAVTEAGGSGYPARLTFGTTADGGTDPTERMRIPSTGGLQVVNSISVGNATPTTSGAGITFPATQSASTNANTLDDYEEGTYTPTQSNFTVTGTPTITGAYTKIGRVVYFDISFGSTGTIAFGVSCLITLPFTGIDRSGMVSMAVLSNSESMTSGKSGVQMNVDASNARFFVGNFTTTSSGESLTFSGFYRVS
jgi:hypothetical protein